MALRYATTLLCSYCDEPIGGDVYYSDKDCTYTEDIGAATAAWHERCAPAWVRNKEVSEE